MLNNKVFTPFKCAVIKTILPTTLCECCHVFIDENLAVSSANILANCTFFS